MKNIFLFLVAALGLAVSACTITGDPTTGGIFWSPDQARMRLRAMFGGGSGCSCSSSPGIKEGNTGMTVPPNIICTLTLKEADLDVDAKGGEMVCLPSSAVDFNMKFENGEKAKCTLYEGMINFQALVMASQIDGSMLFGDLIKYADDELKKQKGNDVATKRAEVKKGTIDELYVKNFVVQKLNDLNKTDPSIMTKHADFCDKLRKTTCVHESKHVDDVNKYVSLVFEFGKSKKKAQSWWERLLGISERNGGVRNMKDMMIEDMKKQLDIEKNNALRCKEITECINKISEEFNTGNPDSFVRRYYDCRIAMEIRAMMEEQSLLVKGGYQGDWIVDKRGGNSEDTPIAGWLKSDVGEKNLVGYLDAYNQNKNWNDDEVFKSLVEEQEESFKKIGYYYLKAMNACKAEYKTGDESWKLTLLPSQIKAVQIWEGSVNNAITSVSDDVIIEMSVNDNKISGVYKSKEFKLTGNGSRIKGKIEGNRMTTWYSDIYGTSTFTGTLKDGTWMGTYTVNYTRRGLELGRTNQNGSFKMKLKGIRKMNFLERTDAAVLNFFAQPGYEGND